VAEAAGPASLRRDTTVRAAGGVLWRPSSRTDAGAGVEVAVVHRPKYDDWSLPKGKLDRGEATLAGACREVREETGFDVVAGRTLGVSRYDVLHRGRPAPKTVHWWAMRATGGEFVPNGEIDELRWLPPEHAPALLSQARDADPLRVFLDGPPQTRTLLLLRHGSAGSRETWEGDDDLRPLDATGLAQADAARDLLPLYGVQRLLSAPLERCTATLGPLAEQLGLPVEPEPALSAAGWSADPAAALQRTVDLVCDGRPTVVCSQGEVLPGLVAELGRRAGLPLDAVEAAKGSLWALSFDDTGRLLDADYTDLLQG
jgi:8-oxo-(d)GTP phosphatase